MRIIWWAVGVIFFMLGAIGWFGLPQDVMSANAFVEENAQTIRTVLLGVAVIGLIATLPPVRGWISRHVVSQPPASTAIRAEAGGMVFNNSTVVLMSAAEALREVAPPELPPEPQPEPPQPEEGTFVIGQPDGSVLIPTVIRGGHFRITDIPLGVNVVKGQAFEDCRIEGPAILYPAGGNLFEECYFETVESEEALLWEVEPGRVVVGALQLRDCRFTRCNFRVSASWGRRNHLTGSVAVTP